MKNSIFNQTALVLIALLGAFSVAHAEEAAIVATDDAIASEIMSDVGVCSNTASSTTQETMSDDGSAVITISVDCPTDGDYTPDPDANAASVLDETTLPEVTNF